MSCGGACFPCLLLGFSIGVFFIGFVSLFCSLSLFRVLYEWKVLFVFVVFGCILYKFTYSAGLLAVSPRLLQLCNVLHCSGVCYIVVMVCPVCR